MIKQIVNLKLGGGNAGSPAAHDEQVGAASESSGSASSSTAAGVDGAAKSDRSRQSLFHISVLNVAACFSVIMLHCNGVFWSFPEGKLWFTSNFIETFFYFAVPIFFMCSGITLLDYPKRYATSEYFHKRISKTVIPFLFWSVVAFIYWAYMDNAAGKAVDWNVAHILVNILNTKYMGVYWFFIPLFGVYMSIPVLANLQNKREILSYIVILTLILGAAFPLLCKVFSVQYNQGIVPGVLSGYLIFVAAGYLLNAHEFTRSQRYAIYAIALLGWLMHMGGTMILSEHGKGINQMFKGYLNLPAILQACGVFVFIKYEITPLVERLNLKKAVIWLSKRTFGVYLLHMYFLWQIPQLLHFSTASIVWRTAGAVAVFAACSLTVFLLQKLPLGKKILP